MAYIEMIAEEKAEGELKSLYDAYRAPWGGPVFRSQHFT